MTRRLSDTHIRQIRALARTGAPKTAIARAYGISFDRVQRIVRRQVYDDVPDFVSGESFDVERPARWRRQRKLASTFLYGDPWDV